MTSAELRAQLERLRMSQTAAAHLLGVNGRTVRGWAQGRADVPPPAQRLLWACERDPTLPAALMGNVGPERGRREA